MSEKILRCVWSVESDPADVLRSDVVSVSSEATPSTIELFPFSISFGDVSAFRTCPACVFGVNEDYGYSYSFGFILDKALQLIETPSMDCSSLIATVNRYPQPYAFEVFKGYSSEGVLSFWNNPFAYGMVDGCCESMFFSASFLEQTFSRLCSFGLEFASDFCVSTSFSVEFFANPSLSIDIRSYVFDSDIYSEKVLRQEGFCFGNFNCGCNVELFVFENKICLSPDFVNSFLLVCAFLDGDFLSAFKCEYGDGFKPFPTEDTLVVDDCSMQVECCCCFVGSVSFVGICHFADGSHSHLGRELEVFPDFTVNKVMELPIVKSFSLESGFSNVVAGSVEAFHSLKESLELGFVWNDFNQERLLHICKKWIIPDLMVTRRFLSQLKQIVFSEIFL